jgi:AhpD family alkylhydroperoxidase
VPWRAAASETTFTGRQTQNVQHQKKSFFYSAQRSAASCMNQDPAFEVLGLLDLSLTLMNSMNTRFKMVEVQPGAYKAMNALEQFLKASSISPLQREMINIRASQINGCAYCLHLHTRDARKLNETEHRIYLMSVWREAPNVFNEEEQLLLEITEEITLIHHRGLSEALYKKAVAIWGEERTAQVIMAVITINAWNRIGVGLKMHPDLQ